MDGVKGNKMYIYRLKKFEKEYTLRVPNSIETEHIAQHMEDRGNSKSVDIMGKIMTVFCFMVTALVMYQLVLMYIDKTLTFGAFLGFGVIMLFFGSMTYNFATDNRKGLEGIKGIREGEILVCDGYAYKVRQRYSENSYSVGYFMSSKDERCYYEPYKIEYYDIKEGDDLILAVATSKRVKHCIPMPVIFPGCSHKKYIRE